MELTGHATLGVDTSADLTMEWSTEHWQFFAFAFAAIVTLAFSLIDEFQLLSWPWGCRLGLKVVVFFVIGYFTLRHRTCKRWLVRGLRIIRTVQD
jgi:hypothetical protein